MSIIIHALYNDGILLKMTKRTSLGVPGVYKPKMRKYSRGKKKMTQKNSNSHWKLTDITFTITRFKLEWIWDLMSHLDSECKCSESEVWFILGLNWESLFCLQTASRCLWKFFLAVSTRERFLSYLWINLSQIDIIRKSVSISIEWVFLNLIIV